MASSFKGNLIAIEPGDTFILNMPIVNASPLSSAQFTIDGVTLYASAGNPVIFPSIYGYPGYSITNNGTSRLIIMISEFGDVLNRDYFTDWRTE